MNSRTITVAPTPAGEAQAPAVDVTFVACVEAGPLEDQTVMLIESLRKWGGRFADCPVLAITPRKGARLSAATRAAFGRLGVTWKAFRIRHQADWYGPMNKPAALSKADQLVETNTVVWLDSDTLVIGEPNELLLDDGFGFAALPSSSQFDIASDGSNSHEAFWRAIIQWHGFDPTEYPFIPARPGESGTIRMYWQGGVYSYRRDSRLGARHFRISREQIESQIASRCSGAYFSEQTSLALAVHEAGLNPRVLPSSHNLMINSLAERLTVSDEEVRDAKIVHYFGSMWADAFPDFVEKFSIARPDVKEWLLTKGALHDSRPLVGRAISKFKRQLRKAASEAYLERCVCY